MSFSMIPTQHPPPPYSSHDTFVPHIGVFVMFMAVACCNEWVDTDVRRKTRLSA